MKNKSVPFSAEEIQDALSDPKFLDELQDIEREWEDMKRTAMRIALSVSVVVGGLIFLKMVWG